MIRHLLVIGAQRCGTTYLHALLDAHPEITMARPSRPEPKVFCSGEVASRGARWYRDTYFRHATSERILGEKSTSYLEDAEAATRAAEVLGEVHVVAVLRDPVERAISNWRFSSRHGFETRGLEAALRENLAGTTPWDPRRTSVSPYAYLERGRYHEYLQPWIDAFPDTSHVVFLEDLVKDDQTTVDLLTRLGVSPDPAAEPPATKMNSSRRVGSGGLSGELLGTLETYYESSNLALSAQLGRELPW